MIISASRRTDIPALYPEWLIKRLRAGFVNTINPYNPSQVWQISLKPEDIDLMVFWTKNPAPLLSHLETIDQMGLPYYFQFTLNDYPPLVEPGLPHLEDRIATLRRLAERIGKERIIWRYDPIMFTQQTDFDYHSQRFAALCARLGPYVDRVVISIVDEYPSSMRRLAKLAGQGYAPLATPHLSPEFGRLLTIMVESATAVGLAVYSCAEPLDLHPFGVRTGKCIDDQYIRRVFGKTVPAKKDPAQRRECGCVVSRDIGSYNSCIHGCVYCYATRNPQIARRNHECHQVDSPTLLERCGRSQGQS